MGEDIFNKLRQLLDPTADIENLMQALKNRDQDLQELENALEMNLNPTLSANVPLMEIHRNFVGKACGSVLRGYIVGKDEEWVYLSSKAGGRIESKVHRSTILDVQIAKEETLICIETE